MPPRWDPFCRSGRKIKRLVEEIVWVSYIEDNVRVAIVEMAYVLPGMDVELFNPPDLYSHFLSRGFPCRLCVSSMLANPFLKLWTGDKGRVYYSSILKSNKKGGAHITAQESDITVFDPVLSRFGEMGHARLCCGGSSLVSRPRSTRAGNCRQAPILFTINSELILRTLFGVIFLSLSSPCPLCTDKRDFLGVSGIQWLVRYVCKAPLAHGGPLFVVHIHPLAL